MLGSSAGILDVERTFLRNVPTFFQPRGSLVRTAFFLTLRIVPKTNNKNLPELCAEPSAC
jgi:hypothetical protein